MKSTILISQLMPNPSFHRALRDGAAQRRSIQTFFHRPRFSGTRKSLGADATGRDSNGITHEFDYQGACRRASAPRFG
jgi:hypothetical protein